MREIIIAGAGPAGMTAGINLALMGHRVKIYEKGWDVGDRFSGDFQALENYSSQEDVLDSIARMRLPSDFLVLPFQTMDLFDAQLNRRVVVSPRAGLYLIRRGSDADTFDQSLKRRALEVGVRFHFGHPIDADKADVVATGPRNTAMVAAGINFRVPASVIRHDGDAERIALILSSRVAPGGYSYLAMGRGRGTLAVVLFSEYARARKCLEGAVATFQKVYDLKLEEPQPFSGRGDFFLPRSYEVKGKLFTGEAAGLQDYWFGFGIRYAVTSGFLAARAISEGVDLDQLLKESGLIAQARISLANRLIYELMGRNSYRWLIDQWTASDDVLELMGHKVNPSLLRRVVYAMARLSLGQKRDLGRLIEGERI